MNSPVRVRRTISNIDPHGLVEHTVFASRPSIPSSIRVSVSVIPWRSDTPARRVNQLVPDGAPLSDRITRNHYRAGHAGQRGSG